MFALSCTNRSVKISLETRMHTQYHDPSQITRYHIKDHIFLTTNENLRLIMNV